MNKLFVLQNRLDALISFNEQFEEYSNEIGIPPDVLMHLELVLEEILTNIINYAYEDQQQHEIRVSVEYKNGRLRLEFVDDGIAFDPTQQAAPDVSASIEERRVGGLGIFLVGKLMDTVSYRREQEHNILTIEKEVSL